VAGYGGGRATPNASRFGVKKTRTAHHRGANNRKKARQRGPNGGRDGGIKKRGANGRARNGVKKRNRGNSNYGGGHKKPGARDDYGREGKGRNNYCGYSFEDAALSCRKSCARGFDVECHMGMTYFADVMNCPATSPGGAIKPGGKGGKGSNGQGGGYGGNGGGWGGSSGGATGQGYKPMQGYYPLFDEETCVQDSQYPNYMRTNASFYFATTINECCCLHYKGTTIVDSYT